MQSLPRPPASVPLGGSLRASRAAQLAAPEGPLAAVDLADGRPLMAELRGSLWVELAAAEATLLLPAPLPEPSIAPIAPRRRRRLGTLLVLAAALGAAAVGLATGLSGAPAPAVAGPTALPRALAAPRASAPGARGGRAAALRRAGPAVPAPVPVEPAPAVSAAPAPPPAPPPPVAPPPLPELPAAPAL